MENYGRIMDRKLAQNKLPYFIDNNKSIMCDGCSSEDRICCNYLVSAYQRHKNRIKVIIVGETLGY